MKNSPIKWTTHSWNLWEGCSRVSPGCLRCLAENASDHPWGRLTWGPDGNRRQIASTWSDPHKWHRDVIETGVRARVCCSSLADIFDEHPSIEPMWRHHLWKTIRETPCLDWLLITKRPENFKEFLPDDWGHGYPNACLIVSVENQDFAAQRIPVLLETPASRRALTVEPMIGPVHLSPWIDQLDWVIVGGESLTGARPMNPNWVREIRDLCHVHSRPFFFKQWGWWTPETLAAEPAQYTFPDGEVVFRSTVTTIFGTASLRKQRSASSTL